ncbi:peptidase S8/S53 domain-containing protein [Leptodontidium sp. MPI-SDFR-AT-0119]|nr:peptidase S8/S53 domain-containing protein [Leptodontidium sp. MPI-SDFR-AT-0119]
MAPGLRQVTVYGVSYTNAHIIHILQEMASPTQGEPLPSQITTSYYFFYDQNVYDALARLAVQGQALFAASGDFGSYNEKTGSGAFPPVDHPLVTSVGGTELVTSGPGGTWVSETTASFSGGGYSPWGASDPQFIIPWWQAGMDYTASKGSTTVRNAPDVSIIADRITVFSGGGWKGFAGTSAAAPLWAGFLALANEQAVSSGRPPIGFANPALWEIGRGPYYSACFHDVTTGNNFNATNPNLYPAGSGYDLCTGWGTPNGQSLIDALARSRQTVLRTDSASWVAPDAAGRLELFARGNDGALWHIWQTVINGGWSSWFSHGSPRRVRLNGSPIVGRNLDGRLQVFLLSTDSQLWYIAQTTPGGGWGSWTSLGKPASTTLTDSSVIASNADGRLEIFTQGADSALWHIWQTTPNGTWSSWVSQGKPPSGGVQGSLCIAPSQDGRLEVFAVGLDGDLWHTWQTAVNNGWSSWFSHGNPGQGQTFGGSTIPPVMAAQADGRLHLFIPTLGGPMWRISQTAVNNGWSKWTSHGQPGGSPGYLFSDPPAIASNADGRLELFIPAQGGVWHIWQTTPNGAWSGWYNQLPDTSGGPVPVDGSVALAPNADGRLEMAMLGFDSAVWHIWQTAVNNGWSAPSSYGKPPNVRFEANR